MAMTPTNRGSHSVIGLLLGLILLASNSYAFVGRSEHRQSPRTSPTRQKTTASLLSSLSSSSSSRLSVWKQSDLDAYAATQGVSISITTLGPAYRAVARSTHNDTQILGYVEGFLRPTGNLLHLDKMEVFRVAVKRARRENPDFTGGGTVLGVGLLLGYRCLLHGQLAGKCHTAEFLAIDDEDFQHKRLVRYYKQAGFEVIKYVGEGFQDVPDRLVWGGCGTLLRKDIVTLLSFWTSLMEKSREKAAAR